MRWVSVYCKSKASLNPFFFVLPIFCIQKYEANASVFPPMFGDPMDKNDGTTSLQASNEDVCLGPGFPTLFMPPRHAPRCVNEAVGGVDRGQGATETTGHGEEAVRSNKSGIAAPRGGGNEGDGRAVESEAEHRKRVQEEGTTKEMEGQKQSDGAMEAQKGTEIHTPATTQKAPVQSAQAPPGVMGASQRVLLQPGATASTHATSPVRLLDASAFNAVDAVGNIGGGSGSAGDQATRAPETSSRGPKRACARPRNNILFVAFESPQEERDKEKMEQWVKENGGTVALYAKDCTACVCSRSLTSLYPSLSPHTTPPPPPPPPPPRPPSLRPLTPTNPLSRGLRVAASLSR
jgi:hypothetical protein